jgi:hypothetical protein
VVTTTIENRIQMKALVEREQLWRIEKRLAKSRIPLKNLIDFPRFLMFFFQKRKFYVSS